MTTAVDTNIFLSILTGDTLESAEASQALLQAASDGPLVTSVICYAELVRQFDDQAELDGFLANLGCEVIPLNLSIAFLAGRYFSDYRHRGGDKSRILADFLIAAFALLSADRLLTNDRQFFGSSFPQLQVIQPRFTSTPS